MLFPVLLAFPIKATIGWLAKPTFAKNHTRHIADLTTTDPIIQIKCKGDLNYKAAFIYVELF